MENIESKRKKRSQRDCGTPPDNLTFKLQVISEVETSCHKRVY